MTETRASAPTNHLFELLSRRDRASLLALCEPVPLVLAEVLCEAGQPAPFAYFPTEGFISLLTVASDAPALEVGMVGSEGMVGAHLALGVDASPLRALVQGVGEAWRIGAKPFRAELRRNPVLRRSLDRYVYVLMKQQAASAACLRFHPIGPRLARWLLMSQDRAHSESFRVTQEFLAYMLGVRRSGVTAAASVLQRGGLIEYTRGNLTVIDRPRLENAACGCYAADRRAYAELL